jgi:uncharacterized protein YbjQ (UPF0145 family)
MELIVIAILTTLGYFFGRIAENRHFKSIRLREIQYKDILVFNERHLPAGVWRQGPLVGGNVVISVDYFKRLVAGLRALFGGRLSTYESLLERARREAILRMKAQARSCGAGMIINVRLETASISKGREGQVGSVEVYAYGTALVS